MGDGRVSAWGAVHMAAALAGCRKALVGTGWTISHLVSTNRLRNHSPPTTSGLIGSIQSGGGRTGQRGVTNLAQVSSASSKQNQNTDKKRYP